MNSVADPPFYTLLEGISWDTYVGIAEALSEYRNRHTYLDGRLEIRRVIPGVSWHDYMRLLEAFGQRSIRHTYLDGWLEIMSPLKEHDWMKRLMGRMVEHMCMQLKISIQSVGSMTVYKGKLKGGLQPDEAYYVQNERKVRGKKTYDREKDPPPDLAIEVDVTNSCIDRLESYSRLRIPELWRHDGQDLHFLVLSRGAYRAVAKSNAFPFLAPGDLQQFLDVAEELEENEVIERLFQRAKKLHRSYLRNKQDEPRA